MCALSFEKISIYRLKKKKKKPEIALKIRWKKKSNWWIQRAFKKKIYYSWDLEKIDGGKKQRKGERCLSWSINTRHNSEPPVFARSSCNCDMKIDP